MIDFVKEQILWLADNYIQFGSPIGICQLILIALLVVLLVYPIARSTYKVKEILSAGLSLFILIVISNYHELLTKTSTAMFEVVVTLGVLPTLVFMAGMVVHRKRYIRTDVQCEKYLTKNYNLDK